MAVGKRRPPWVKSDSAYDKHIDVKSLLPSVSDVPRMMDAGALGSVQESLHGSGFRVVEAFLGEFASERVFAGCVLRSLGLWGEEEAAWGLFVDRVWDFYREGGQPVLVAIYGIDEWMLQDFKLGVRCIFKSASVCDSLFPDDGGKRRQIEFLFLGHWEAILAEK